MPYKKKHKRSTSPSKKILTSVGLAALIVVVGYLVFIGNSPKTDASLTAARGTVARSEQIESAELQQEKSIGNDADTQQQANAQSDSTALAQVGQAARDEE